MDDAGAKKKRGGGGAALPLGEKKKCGLAREKEVGPTSAKQRKRKIPAALEGGGGGVGQSMRFLEGGALLARELGGDRRALLSVYKKRAKAEIRQKNSFHQIWWSQEKKEEVSSSRLHKKKKDTRGTEKENSSLNLGPPFPKKRGSFCCRGGKGLMNLRRKKGKGKKSCRQPGRGRQNQKFQR